jgi:hypothetical protein
MRASVLTELAVLPCHALRKRQSRGDRRGLAIAFRDRRHDL